MKNKFKRITYSIFLVILLSLSMQVNATEHKLATTIYSQQTNDIETIFKNSLFPFESIIYSITPQGLIISIDSNLFFSESQIELLNTGKIFLNKIANALNQIPNNLVIEVNSDKANCSNKMQNWELTTIQAGQIAKYLIIQEKISPNRVQAIGFGEISPNLPKEITFPNRIDFIILNYEIIPQN